MKEYHKNYYKNNKEYFFKKANSSRIRNFNFVLEIKKASKCKYCKNNIPECLDFHHRKKEEKISSISSMISRGVKLETLKIEIEKCDILCANCHRLVHFKNKVKSGKLKLIEEAKKDKPCSLCKNHYSTACMDFHHIKDKIFDLSHPQNRTHAEILLEIKKCILLCTNCHRLEHTKLTQKTIEKYKKQKIEYKCIDCNRKRTKTATRCKQCSGANKAKNNTNRPSKETLENDLKVINNWTKIGRKYNVSDSTIRKWAKYYGLLV